jgi:hypothetical protein
LEINVSGNFLLVQTFPNQVLFEFFIVFFEKNCFDQILVELRKIKVLLKKPCHFSDFFSQKSGKSSEFLYYFAIFVVALQTCILKNLFWNQFAQVHKCISNLFFINPKYIKFDLQVNEHQFHRHFEFGITLKNNKSSKIKSTFF